MRREISNARFGILIPDVPSRSHRAAPGAVVFGSLAGALSAFAVAVSCGGCGSQKNTRPGETFDAGYVFADSTPKVSREFTVRNPTDRTVRILDVAKTCGCTSFDLRRWTLGPGESTTLRINVNTPLAYQQVYSACTLKTEHPMLTDWPYTIKFTALPRVAFSTNHVNFGRIAKNGPELAQTAYVDTFDGPPDLLMQEDLTAPAGLSVELSPEPERHRLAENVWNVRHTIVIKLQSPRADKSGGMQTRSIDVRAHNGARASLPVIWSYDEPIVRAPSVIGFGKVAPGSKSQERILFLHSSVGKRFRILSASSAPGSPPVSAEFERKESDQHKLQLTLQLPEGIQAPALSGKIQITTDHEAAPVVEVPWSAIVDPIPLDRPRSSCG